MLTRIELYITCIMGRWVGRRHRQKIMPALP